MVLGLFDDPRDSTVIARSRQNSRFLHTLYASQPVHVADSLHEVAAFLQGKCRPYPGALLDRLVRQQQHVHRTEPGGFLEQPHVP